MTWVCGILHQHFAVTHYVSPQEIEDRLNRSYQNLCKGYRVKIDTVMKKENNNG